MNTAGPHTGSGGAKVVVFVPPAKVFVKEAGAVQFVSVRSHVYSGTGAHPFVPVDCTTTLVPTLRDTMRAGGGVGGSTMVRVPVIALWNWQL